jgi:hypothetical protein
MANFTHEDLREISKSGMTAQDIYEGNLSAQLKEHHIFIHHN